MTTPSALSRFQSPMQAAMAPGAWLPGFRRWHYLNEERGLGKGTKEEYYEMYAKALKDTQGKELFEKMELTEDASAHELKLRLWTNKSEWLDVYKFRFAANDAGDVAMHVWAASTGLVPTSVPLAPVLNIVLCWVPFEDHGYLRKRMKILEDAVGAGKGDAA
mmetsp:Transcript_11414/g.28885  ORF Transcript_11414/g.28885 Transcript_11414/m.28885 type:complete len:162 (+) Transcript_11414:233-718(+)